MSNGNDHAGHGSESDDSDWGPNWKSASHSPPKKARMTSSDRYAKSEPGPDSFHESDRQLVLPLLKGILEFFLEFIFACFLF